MSEPREEVVRVSTLELFFDLVFVFTITQLTTVLVRQPDARGFLQAALMLGVIWWMYGGYAWLTNLVAPDRISRRLLLLGGMGAYLVLALSIPRAFSDSGLAFGLAYLAVVCVHAGLFARSSSATVVQAVFGIARYNLVSALMVLAGGIAGGTAEYVLWGIAVLFEWVTPRLIEGSGFQVRPAHFVERHGLVVIVAIGESVVAVGIGATGLPINAELAGVAVLGLVLSACLWWSYFGSDDDERAERALAATGPERRPIVAVDAFGLWHLPILYGIVAIAAALRHSTGHAFDDLQAAQALALGGGVALYLAGDVLFRRSLGLRRSGWRLGAAAVALVTIPLGLELAAAAQLAAIVAVVLCALVAEQRVAVR